MTISRQIFEYDPVFAYRYVPNISVRVPFFSGGYLVRTNEQGFRSNHDFISKKTLGFRRVLLFGDSYTSGDGVSNGKRYGDLLEKMIPNLEVYNFGMPGTGTDQHYLIYQNAAQNIEHDVMVISVLVENIRRIVAKYKQFHDAEGEHHLYAKPYYRLEEVNGNESLVLHGVPPLRKLISPNDVSQKDVDTGGRFGNIRNIVKRLKLKKVTQHVTRYNPLPQYDKPDHPDWLLMKAILKSFISHHPKPVLLFPIPLRQHIEKTCATSKYGLRFSELAKETSCIVHDPLKDLLQYSKEDRRGFSFDDDHPTPKGHQSLAKSLAPVLEHLLENAKPLSNI